MERIKQFILAQLTQGTSPEKLALSCALGISLATFPILGSTTLLCFLAGAIWKLNQPVLQALNYFMYPVQIALIFFFVRLGESLFHQESVSIQPTLLVKEFFSSPAQFFSHYGMAALCAIAAWALLAPFMIGAIYFSTKFLFSRWQQRKHSL